MEEFSCWCVILGIAVILIIHLILKEYGILENFESGTAFIAGYESERNRLNGLEENELDAEDSEDAEEEVTYPSSIQGGSSQELLGEDGDPSSEDSIEQTLTGETPAPSETPAPTETPAPSPIDCVGSWGEWSNCSETCGGGQKTRDYSITTPAENGGDECPAEDGDIITQDCNTQACPNISGVLRNGFWIKPLNMSGQGRTSASWEECRDRCINTPGCEYFNRFPNGGCHITDGSQGPSPGGNNPTSHSGRARAFTPNNNPKIDGRWYMPLNMPGQGRTSASWTDCRDRCIHTKGCKYFNRFPNGGCHITDGSEGTRTVPGNPTSHSGKALLE